MTILEQIASRELEIQTLSDILTIGIWNPKLKWSDLCVQRAEAMASLNALRVRQGKFDPSIAQRGAPGEIEAHLGD